MIKVKRHILPAALMLAALSVSCDKTLLHETPGGTGIPMQIVPSVTGGTRASMTTADLTEFYLQVTGTETAYTYFVKVLKSDTAWSADQPLLWQNETASVTYSAAFYGDHAFNDVEFADSVNLSVPTDQSTQAGLNSADLLMLAATQTSYENTQNGVLPVTLSHGLAKVNLVLTLGDEFYDNSYGLTSNPVTAFTVNGANTGFSFRPQTGVVNVLAGTEAKITPFAGTYTPGTATAKTATAVYEAILVPQTFAAGALSVSFSIGQGNYEWTNTTAITLAAGTTVNLPLSVTTALPVDPYNGHEYVDLGLPSGLKWATCNVGASKPEEYGDYFAWGDTALYYEPGHAQDDLQTYWKDDKKKTDGYNWSTYKWCEGLSTTLTKYCSDSYFGSNDFQDTKTTLEAKDDAASYNWGGSWRMPTKAEIDELIATKDNTDDYTWTWCDGNNTKYSGTDVRGWQIVRNSTGATLFLPAAGYRGGTGLYDVGSYGYYWSSSLDTVNPNGAYGLGFSSDYVSWNTGYRSNGQSVRPVCP